MRHLGSVFLSLLLVPVSYVSLGVGMSYWQQHLVTGEEYTDKLTVALVAFAVAGLAYSVLVLARLSPLGLVLGGLALAGVSGWALLATDVFEETVPRDIAGVNGAGWAASPLTLVLAVPLLATIASPRRWRRWANPPAALVAPGNAAAPAYPTAADYTAVPVYEPVAPSAFPPESSAGGYQPPPLPQRTPTQAPPTWPSTPIRDAETTLDTERTRRL